MVIKKEKENKHIGKKKKVRRLRVSVQRKVVVKFDYSGMVQLLVDSVFSTGMSGVDKTNEHEKLGRQREEKKRWATYLW